MIVNESKNVRAGGGSVGSGGGGGGGGRGGGDRPLESKIVSFAPYDFSPPP